jgi:DNA mismatch endonuclease (patch repair protein)
VSRFQTTDKLRAHMRTIRKTDIRRLVHAMGYRYRLHRRDLPGTPDLVFAGRRKVIFVHGCFWHRHDCVLGRKQPSANPHYWPPKLERNAAKDWENMQRLSGMGWAALVLWECELGEERAYAAESGTEVWYRRRTRTEMI